MSYTVSTVEWNVKLYYTITYRLSGWPSGSGADQQVAGWFKSLPPRCRVHPWAMFTHVHQSPSSINLVSV